LVCFFFSSRRRHTRFSRDWSSDVCSSDLGTAPHLSGELLADMAQVNIVHIPYKGSGPAQSDLLGGHISLLFSTVAPSVPLIQQRSEERRVGKEGRWPWRADE